MMLAFIPQVGHEIELSNGGICVGKREATNKG